MAIVVISSELPEMMGISDRIIVMCGGRVAAEHRPRPDFNDERRNPGRPPCRTFRMLPTFF
jgi:L-arabinose transport system ATP-binding protein